MKKRAPPPDMPSGYAVAMIAVIAVGFSLIGGCKYKEIASNNCPFSVGGLSKQGNYFSSWLLITPEL